VFEWPIQSIAGNLPLAFDGTPSAGAPQPAIARVHEAVVEIRKVARGDPVLAAEGAVQYLQKRLIPTELARRAELNHLAALRSDRIRTAATSIHPWENMVHVQCQWLLPRQTRETISGLSRGLYRATGIGS
jgi:hypothetical protein